MSRRIAGALLLALALAASACGRYGPPVRSRPQAAPEPTAAPAPDAAGSEEEEEEPAQP